MATRISAYGYIRDFPGTYRTLNDSIASLGATLAGSPISYRSFKDAIIYQLCYELREGTAAGAIVMRVCKGGGVRLRPEVEIDVIGSEALCREASPLVAKLKDVLANQSLDVRVETLMNNSTDIR